MKRTIACILAMLLLTLMVSWSQAAESNRRQFADWSAIASAMIISLDKAYDSYLQNQPEEAKNWVNDAYFGYYEKEGFERSVLAYISGKRASTVEYQFAVIKRMMTEGATAADVRQGIDYLARMLREDANQLDGREESAIGVFLAALAIILREGFEAILVIAAISAYLVRSGNLRQIRVVYICSLLAVAASIAAAIVMQFFVSAASAANQEIIEGAAMLLATVVLFMVSNWMFSKAEAEAWKNYIEGKVQTAVQTGSAFALGAAAFLAVFREGAETILFYQAMFVEVLHNTNFIWAGVGVGGAALVVIFIIVRYGSMKLPLKPFFIATSVLMYIMAIAFAGGGVKELQEADVIGVTKVNFIDSIDILGIYPTVETLLPQAVMLLLAIFSIVYYKLKNRNVNRVSLTKTSNIIKEIY